MAMPVYGKNLLGHEPDMVYLPLQGDVAFRTQELAGLLKFGP